MLDAKEALGLLLAWHRTQGSAMTLCLIFGITSGTFSIMSCIAHRVLLHILHCDYNAAMQIPTAGEFGTFCEAIELLHALLNNVFASLDGLKLALEQSIDSAIQKCSTMGGSMEIAIQISSSFHRAKPSPYVL